MSMPMMDGANRKKPLCYDPARKRFIYYEEILSGKEPVVLPSTLSKGDQKALILKRYHDGPDFSAQTISGPLTSRNDLVRAIQNDEEIGRVTVEAEISYLNELLLEIEKNR